MKRHPLNNYLTIRCALLELIEDCTKKIEKKRKGRINPKPLRSKLRRIRKMIKSGSYDENS